MTGILGINARNLLYIKPYNKKKVIRLADDKLKTKHFLSARGIPVPKLYGVIKDKEELEKFDFGALPNSFVLKPNFGYGGEGIIVIVNKREEYWVTEGGKKYTKEDLKEHILDILDGRYSIANMSDWAFFEQRIITHDSLKPYSSEGLPDIRVVVHNLIPVMAMLRLPTYESEGKANLHMGGLGVGVDIAKGEATYITYKNKIIDEIPGVGPIRRFKIPFWDEILMIASRVQLMTNLGYLAADIALDQNGPVLLEINARAGLSVQIANLAPLRKRLERIEGVKVATPEKGVRIAKDMFGNVIEKQIKEVSGKEIIGTRETIELLVKNEIFHVNALIDNHIERSYISKKIVEKLKLLEKETDYDPEKNTLKLKFNLANKRIQTIAKIIDITQEDTEFVVGKRDLGQFLIDPSRKQENILKGLSEIKEIEKTKEKEKNQKKKINYYDIDQKLIKIDKKIKLIFYLTPINLEEEKLKFFKNFTINPQFLYADFPYEFEKIKAELMKIETDDSPLGKLFNKKKQEIQLKLELLERIGTVEFSAYSEKLYGNVDSLIVKEAEERIKNRGANNQGKIQAKEAKLLFEKKFEEYGLKEWKVRFKKNMVSDCSASKGNTLFLKESASFSEERIKKLIAHEIEVHILTKENGKYQPYEIFSRGLAGYLETQEGLAIVVQDKALGIPADKSFLASDSLIAVSEAEKGSFVDVFNKLLSFNISMERAFNLAVKVKRGLSNTKEKGGFTKEISYFKGAKKVLDFLNKGGDLKSLYIGKIALEDLDLIKKIPNIVPPKYYPNWL